MGKINDITGQTIGTFYVVSRYYVPHSIRTVWNVKCTKCGKEQIINKHHLCDMKCSCSYKYENYTKEIPHHLISSIVKKYVSGSSSLDIAKEFGVSGDSVLRLCKNLGYKIRNYKEASHKFICDDDYFECIDSADKSYWLGFITADGNIYKNALRISLKISDINHLNKFKNCIKSEHKIVVEPKYNRCSFGLRSEKMIEDLFKSGITENKSLTVMKCTNIPQKFMRDYWRGLIDGDGYIGNEKRHRIGLCGTYDIVNGFREYLISCGFPVISQVHSLGKIFRFYTSTDYFQIYSHLYVNSNMFLERKYHEEYIV